MTAVDELENRYSRQILLPKIGESGQAKLQEGSALIVGCGALGSVISEVLVRAGVGVVRIIDRDFVELSNLQRQVLFDEEDVAQRMPKAEAAVRKLRQINSTIQIDALVADVNPRNVEELVAQASIVLDGTDNLETRYVLNDACVKLNKPWVYGGAVGTEGLIMAIVPNEGPCLRCLFPEPAPPGGLTTCDTAGVLGTTPLIVAAIQATEAIKLLVGDTDGVGHLTSLDVWHSQFHRTKVKRQSDCPTCHDREFRFLSSGGVAWVTTLCGRNAVQITPAEAVSVDLESLRVTLAKVGQTQFNGLLLTFIVDERELIVFPDGRAIVKGTTDEAEAKTLYARYVGG